MTNRENTGEELSSALGVTELAIFEAVRRAGGGQVILADFKYDNSRAYDVKVGPDGDIDAISVVDGSNGANLPGREQVGPPA
ncbi:Uncharacterised protein [Mycobacteroides abscessus subsp. abscessus]|uniref:hypothetical protein n=1 Tax=Mycobacteroides abscessus TaxID=36809 RepID=UPI0009A8F503|nr:hypothetical protein [Mycobacteroides abscessus]SLI19254.1 Uncharacterised protein [Mycobacteroides abscessus subsp. abscessus]